MGNYAGVDWASAKHDVVVQNEAGEELLAASFAHDEKGLRALCRTLMRLKVRTTSSSDKTPPIRCPGILGRLSPPPQRLGLKEGRRLRKFSQSNPQTRTCTWRSTSH